MKLKFLCHQHRNALAAAPNQARDFWIEAHDRLSEQLPVATPRSISLAGSALEAAGLYVLHGQANADDIDRYAASALILIDLLRQLDEIQLALIVTTGANAALEELARRSTHRETALRACRRITFEGLDRLDARLTRNRGRVAHVAVHAPSATLH